MTRLIARDIEKKRLKEAFSSDKSEFVAIYGRRRVGKTFLVKKVFNNSFTFLHTGIAEAPIDIQLENFRLSLENFGMELSQKLHDWFEAFEMLSTLIKGNKSNGKKIIFLDELPWMDTHKSRFVVALEHFWNGFAALREDVMLIVCGSATSWVINKIINNHGGLHNRVTHQLYLRPFTLGECERLAASYDLRMSRRDILQNYMIMGGIPYYWSLLNKGLSQPQNIDALCFTRGGEMVGEFDKLYSSLFKRPEPYIAIITALATKKCGMTREEIANMAKLNDGGKLTKYLEELEQCDFIRRFTMIGKTKKGTMFQLIDPYTLFYFKFMKSHSLTSGPIWVKLQGKPKFNAWIGIAFERACLLHIDQIRKKLGISGVITAIHSWQKKNEDLTHGAQIDLLIDREDGVINVCEMKYYSGQYAITKKDCAGLQNKLDAFSNSINTKKAVHVTMITSYGIVPNEYSSMVQSEIIADDLFNDN